MGTDPLVSFVIPFRSKASTAGEESWRRVSSLLLGTVRNLLSQTSRNYTIHVVGDEFPAGGLPEDDKLFFHKREFQHHISDDDRGKNRDRRMRVVQGCIHAGSLNPGYIMPVDADDRISNKLVAWLETQEQHPCWLVEQGFVLDYASRRFTKSDRYSHQTSSSILLSTSETGIAKDLSFAEMDKCYWFLGGHSQFKEDMAKRGVSIRHVPFPAGCYLTGYGDNLSSIFAQSPISKIRRWLRFHLKGKPFSSDLKEEFGEFNSL